MSNVEQIVVIEEINTVNHTQSISRCVTQKHGTLVGRGYTEQGWETLEEVVAQYKQLPAGTNIDATFLDNSPRSIFVFGDNIIRKGTAGAAKLRYHPRSYGFITKKLPNNDDTSFFRPVEYRPLFNKELHELMELIVFNPDNIFLISKIGAGLANRYGIYEQIIQPGLETLRRYSNVVLLK